VRTFLPVPPTNAGGLNKTALLKQFKTRCNFITIPTRSKFRKDQSILATLDKITIITFSDTGNHAHQSQSWPFLVLGLISTAKFNSILELEF